VFRYSVGGKVTESGLGGADTSRDEAFDRADEIRAKLKAGLVPNAARKAARSPVVNKTPTFADAAEAWLALKEPGWTTGHGAQARYHVEVVAAALRNKPVNDITPDDITAALGDLWTRSPVSARAALVNISQVFGLCVGRKYRLDNPADWRASMKHFLPAQGRVKQHRPSMPYADVPAFVAELRRQQVSRATARVLEMIILSGCRAGEVLGATWKEIDLDKALWTIPAARMKSRRAHDVPLTPQLLALLKEAHKFRGPSGLVFESPTRPGAQMHGSSVRALLGAMGRGNVTTHGFRSSLRSFLGAETDCPFDVAEACIAHSCGDATVQAYLRTTALAKRRIYMNRWGEFCDGPSASGNVIPLIKVQS
jgi:integrase